MKPEGLGRELVAMAGIGRGSLVVDPFAGSGALLVGAVERGASVVAGDVAQRAVRLARARLSQAAGKPATRPVPATLGQRPGTGQVPARPRPARGKPAAKPTAKTAPGKVRRPRGRAR